MDELVAALLSWAVLLSGYPAPPAPPRVERVAHAFLVDRACAGRECKVLGWYEGKDVVYLDDRLDPAGDLVAASVLVHELTHYLQGVSARRIAANAGSTERAPGWQFTDCSTTLSLEREAYAAQQAFLVRYGAYRPVGASMHGVGCEATERRERSAQSGPEDAASDAPRAAGLPSWP